MIYVLPGMGATSEMYQGAWRDVRGIRFIDWPEYRGEKTLREVADRLVGLYGVGQDDVFLGTSLGGMVACEMARIVNGKKVILVGSAAHPGEVAPLLRYFSGLAKITPIAFVQKLSGKRHEKLIEMFKQTDAEFIRQMCLAIFEWDGIAEGMELVRIHGRKDLAIPLPGKVDLELDAGHLVVMSHAEECVTWLMKHHGF